MFSGIFQPLRRLGLIVPPRLEMDIPAVCMKGLRGAVLSPFGLI